MLLFQISLVLFSSVDSKLPVDGVFQHQLIDSVPLTYPNESVFTGFLCFINKWVGSGCTESRILWVLNKKVICSICRSSPAVGLANIMQGWCSPLPSPLINENFWCNLETRPPRFFNIERWQQVQYSNNEPHALICSERTINFSNCLQATPSIIYLQGAFVLLSHFQRVWTLRSRV